jgi:hypothetical protein
MKPATLARLAVAGNRTDHLRTVLTAASAALAAVTLLSAATVIAIKGGVRSWADSGTISVSEGSEQYASALLAEAGLRPGVIAALILLSLPILALTGQCIRLGAPARDRRLAAIRLAGATPRQAVLIASAETVAAGLLGAIAGFGVFLLLRVVLERRDAQGKLVLPTDVLPSTVSIAVVLLAVPLLGGLIGALLLRRVVISPLGVVRRTRERSPWPWPGLLIIAGPVLVELPEHLDDTNPNFNVVVTLLAGGVALTVIGVVLGTGWISYTTGRLLRRFGPRPSMLLAGRRLMADPWNGSRTLAALLASVVAGAIALGYRAQLTTQFDAYEQYNASVPDGSGRAGAAAPEGFYLGAVDLIMVAVGVGVATAAAGVLIALAESIVARRRAYAALTAVGVPVRTLSRAVLWQTLLPLLPALLLALVSGIGIARLMGTEVTVGGSDGGTICEAACQAGTEPPTVLPAIAPTLTMAVPVPLDLLALLGGGAFLAMLAAAGVGLLVLRSSTDLDELRVG